MNHSPDFDFIAKYYDLLYANREDDLEMWLELTADIQGDLLEIGCGTGRVLLPLLQAGKQITGIDLSETALSAAQAKIDVGGFANAAKLYQADMQLLDIPKKDFAFAFIPINTFMHCLDTTAQIATLQAIYKHLKPAGTLVIDLYHPHPHALLTADGQMYFENELLDELTNHTIQYFSIRRLHLDQQIQEVTFILDEIEQNARIYRQTFSFPMRYLHRFEMELLLMQTGFQIEQILGDYDLSHFYAESPRMIFIAKKILT